MSTKVQAAPPAPSTLQYIGAIPTVLATVNRYTIWGSPHPKMGLADLIKAALFKRFYGTSLLPPNDQSSIEKRLERQFAPSVTASAVLIEPTYSMYYRGELTNAEVLPAQVPAFYLIPKKQFIKDKIVLYIHGGGYSRGDPTGGGIASAMANRLGRRVCTIDYRLGVTEPFPAAVQDCITAYYYLRKEYAADQIVLAGDSAGGGLVLATLLHLRSLSERPHKAILLSPLMQTLDLGARSYKAFDAVDFIDLSGIELVTGPYQRLNQFSPYIQLFENKFTDFPPLFVTYGDAEVLSDDDREFCKRARADGVQVVEDVGVAKVHVWIALPQYAKEAKQVWSNMKAFIDGEKARL